MRKKRNRFLQFTSKENGNTSSPPVAQVFPSSYTYHSLPLNLFIEQVCNKTIDPIILEQFFESIKDKQSKYIKKLEKEINILEIKFNCIQTSVMYLEKFPGDIEVLSVIRTFILVNTNDSLGIMLTRAKSFIVDAKTKRMELDRIQSGQNSREPDHKYFNQLLVSVGQHMGFQVNKKETTVSEFAEMINNLIETNEAKIVQMNGGRR